MTRARRRIGPLLVAALVPLVAGVAFWAVWSGDRVGRARAVRPGSWVEEGSEPVSALATSPSRTLEGAAREPEGAAAPTGSSRTPPGWLHLAVTDAISARPLQVDLRLLSEGRFHAASADTFRLPLTPGRYQGRLIHRGYEALDLPPIPIQPGEVTDLGVVSMAPGTAALHCAVRGPLPDQGAILVELHGEGRAPCVWCSSVETDRGPKAVDPWERYQPCARCGYGRAFSRKVLESGAGFTFGSLAAGRYFVRWHGDDPTSAGPLEEVTLDVGERRFLGIALTPTRTVPVELVQVDGSPVEGTWERDGVLVDSPIRLEFRRQPWGSLHAMVISRRFAEDGRSSQLDSRQAATVAEFRVGIQKVFQEFGGVIWEEEMVSESFDSVESGTLGTPQPVQPVDQPRGPQDALDPGTPLPAHEADLAATWEDRWISVRGVPVEPLELVVTCGRLRSAPWPVDLERYDGRPLRVVLTGWEEPEVTEYAVIDWDRGEAEVHVISEWEEASWSIRLGPGEGK